LNADEVLDNILVANAYSSDLLSELLNQAAALMMENPFALLIVDSLMAPFRVDFSGRGQLADRQQMLGKILNKLLKLAQQFNIAVYITN